MIPKQYKYATQFASIAYQLNLPHAAAAMVRPLAELEIQLEDVPNTAIHVAPLSLEIYISPKQTCINNNNNNNNNKKKNHKKKMVRNTSRCMYSRMNRN